MSNYQNQNLITDISVDKIKHNSDTSGSWMQPFDWDKMKPIMYLLNGNEFKFYLYLFSWAGKTQYDFSPADLEKRLDFKEDTARKIFKHFIELGFLIKEKNSKYKFDAFPDDIMEKYQKKFISKNMT